MSSISLRNNRIVQAITSKQATAELGYLGTVGGQPLPLGHAGDVCLWIRDRSQYRSGGCWPSVSQARGEALQSPIVQHAHLQWLQTVKGPARLCDIPSRWGESHMQRPPSATQQITIVFLDGSVAGISHSEPMFDAESDS